MHHSSKNDTRRIPLLRMRRNVLLLSIVYYSRNLVQGSNMMPPLLHYDFTMDNCHTGRFRNEGRLDPNTAKDDSIELIRNPNVTSCIYGLGIEFESRSSELPLDHSNSSNHDSPLRYSTTGKSLYSSKPIEVVLNALDDETIVGQEEHGITLSFWIRPHPMHRREKTYGEDRSSWTSPILTIGSSDVRQPSSSAPNGLSSCAKSNLDFQLSMIEDHKLEVVYRTNDPDAEPCQRIEVPLPSRSIATTRLDDDEEEDRRGSSVPVHIMIALTDYNQRVFVNGRNEGTRMIERFDPNLHHWNPQSLLQFFTYSSTENYPLTPPWEGQLFQFSLYRSALEKEQVRAVLSDGLPPSQPLAHQKVVTIQEDANNDDRYTQEIATSYTFLDTEMESLFALLDLPHQHAAPVRHYITRFPSRGSLFHPIDRHQIEPEGTLPVFVNNAERLVYIPVKDEHSDFRGEAYTTFEYCVTTTKIIASSQCVSVTISVVVDPVNDPPVASSLPTYSVYEGVIKDDTDALLLSGSDVDAGDFIQCIQITAPPKMGYLFLSVSSFRKEDNLRHGTLLSTIHNTISGNEAYVEYRFTDYTTTVLQGTSVADYFKFRVQDSTGTWSTEREVRIQISSSVYSYVHSPDESDHWMTNMTQVGGTFHEIVGQDLSGLNRTNGFIFISLPTKGVLRDEHGVSIQQNQIIKSHSAHIDDDAHVKMERIILNYVGIPNICGHKDVLFLNDNLRYQVVAMDATNDIVSVSSIKEVQVTVVCAREPLSMELIDQNESNIVSEFTSRFDDNCSGYMFDFTNESRTACNTVAFVFGFHVKNTETLTQPVLVSMTSSTGLLSLQKEYFSDVHPFDDQLIMRPELYFLSPPEKLRGILSAIHFQSESIGSTDIRIVFQFGDCQHSYLRDHEFSPPTTDCHQTDIRIPVMVQHNRDAAKGYKYPFPWVSLLLILLLGVVLYLKGLVRETLQNIQAVAFQKWKQCRRG